MRLGREDEEPKEGGCSPGASGPPDRYETGRAPGTIVRMEPNDLSGQMPCPDCGEPLPATCLADRCPRCALPLAGPLAARLWVVDQNLAALWGERVMLLAGLRRQAVADPPSASPVYPAAAPPGSAPGRTAEWSRLQVQNLLLSLGVLLMALSAIIFVAVDWGSLGAVGRGAVLSIAVALSGLAAAVASDRSLSATAEAMAVLALVFSAVDLVGIRHSDISPAAGGVSSTSYAAGVLFITALIAAGWSRFLPLRCLRWIAAIGAQGVIPLALLPTVRAVGHPAVAGAALALQSAAVMSVWVAARVRTADRVVQEALRVGGCMAWVIALLPFAVAASYRTADFSALGPIELVGLAGLAVAVALADDQTAFGQASLAATAVSAFLAAASFVPHLTPAWQRPAVEALAVAGLAILAAIPERLRRTPRLVLAAAAFGTAVTGVRSLAQALFGPIAWGRSPWTETWAQAGGARVAALLGPGSPWPGDMQTGLLFVGLAGAVALVSLHYRAARPALVPTVLAVLLLLPLATGMLVPSTLAWEATAGGTMLLLGVRRLARLPAPRRDLPGLTGGVGGALFLVHASLWSLMAPVLTVTMLAAALCMAGLAAVAGASRPPLRIGFVGTAAVLAMTEAGVVARYQGATVPEAGVVLAAAAALLMGGVILAERRFAVLTASFAPVLQALGLAGAAVAVDLADPGPDARIVVLGLVVGAGVLGIVLGTGAKALVWGPLFEVSVCAETTFVTHLANPGVHVLWITLLAAGAACALVAVKHRVHSVAGAVLLIAGSWARLADAHVHLVEPYTLPAAVILLVLGFRRGLRDREARSWSRYGPGLALGLTPSLVQALSGAGLIRPALLGLAALIVVLVGARHRLQAPLALGGAVLLLDAVAQSFPYLADAYNAIPRWVLVALAGALLLGVGATYERRIRGLRALQRRFTELV
jgi:hypothetical protein